MKAYDPLYCRAHGRATRYLAALVAKDGTSDDSYRPIREAHDSDELLEFSMALGTIAKGLAVEHYGDRAQDEMDRLALAALQILDTTPPAETDQRQ